MSTKSIAIAPETPALSVLEQFGGNLLNRVIQIQDLLRERAFRNRNCILRSLNSYDVYGRHGLLCAWHTGIGLDWDKVNQYFARLDTREKTYYVGFRGPLKQLAWFYSILNSGMPIASYPRKQFYLYSSSSTSNSLLDLAILDQYRSAIDYFPHPLVSLPIILERIGHPREIIGKRETLLSRMERRPLTNKDSIRDLYRASSP